MDADILLSAMIQFRRIVSAIVVVENIAVSGGIHDLARLRRTYGGHRWRKVKGTAAGELLTGEIRRAELHWYEAHSIGKQEIKIKRLLN